MNGHPSQKESFNCRVRFRGGPISPGLPKYSALKAFLRIELILKNLDIFQPTLKSDGGDIELIDIEGDKIVVALRGMCSSCPSSQLTLKKFVEAKLKEYVSDDLYVEEVNQ